MRDHAWVAGPVDAMKGAGNPDWVDWDELAAESAAVAITIDAIEAPRDFGHGEIQPVVCRVIVLTGTRVGEVFRNQRITKGGIRPKLAKHKPGDDLCGRVQWFERHGGKFPGLNGARPGDTDLAIEAILGARTEEATKLGTDGSGSASAMAGTEPSSWEPVDLTAFLNGTHVPPSAGLLHRSDGIGLLYPGRVHSFHGESESGKSWVAQIATAEVLLTGATVLYLDFESTADEVIARLLLLGASPQTIAERLRYVQPAVSSDADPVAFSRLLGRSYALAVLDGVTESLGLYGASSNDGDDVTRWGRKLPRRIARETGAAVVAIDHVTKSEDGRGRFAIGSQAKLALLDGAAFTIEPKDVAPGQCGTFILRVGKDRAGQVRRHGGTFRASDRTQEIARIRFDSTDPRKIRYAVEPHTSFVDPDTGESTFRPSYLMGRVSQFVADNPGTNRTEILNGVTGNRVAKGVALDILEREVYVRAESYVSRGKAGKRYSNVRLYREAEDPQLGAFHTASGGRDWVPDSKESGTSEPSRGDPPQTAFQHPVRNLEELSPDLGKRQEPSGRPSTSNQDRDLVRNLLPPPRSHKDQQNGRVIGVSEINNKAPTEGQSMAEADPFGLSGPRRPRQCGDLDRYTDI